MTSIPPQVPFGSFVPTTNVWQISQIQSLNVDPNLKDLLIRLYQNINLISTVLNTKDSGLYPLSEFINGQQYFPNPSLNSGTAQQPSQRQVFRTVVNFGALPNAAQKNVAHNITITATTTFTRIYGAASDSTDGTYIPLPFASTVLNDNIVVVISNTNVQILTASDYSAYTSSYIVLEYIKQ